MSKTESEIYTANLKMHLRHFKTSAVILHEMMQRNELKESLVEKAKLHHNRLAALFPEYISFLSPTGNEQYSMSFEECFNKHFPLGADTFRLIAAVNGESLEEFTYNHLKKYDGSYELNDTLMGALIMHVKLEAIGGFSLDDLLNALEWTDEFKYDVKNLLKPTRKGV